MPREGSSYSSQEFAFSRKHISETFAAHAVTRISQLLDDDDGDASMHFLRLPHESIAAATAFAFDLEGRL